ncbi:hypothetical protein WJX77_008054 [Trebouxia sp. C0004]
MMLPQALTPGVPQSHEPCEQTDSILSSRSSQSPSRHQRAADPRRESTVLFKGFSASTAESGLLEVDEIAHVNGSPELRPLATADVHKNTDTRVGSSSDPALDHVHSLSRLQSVPAVTNSVVASAAEPTVVEANRGVSEHNIPLSKQAVGTGPAAAALARQSQGRVSQAADTGGVRRSVGMRDSMCLFLQLEGAVEGENGFEPEEVLQLDEVRLSGSKASLPVVHEEEEEEPRPQPQSTATCQPDMAPNTAAGRTQQVSHVQPQQEASDPQPQERRPDLAIHQERHQQHHQMLPDQDQDLHPQQQNSLQQQEQQSGSFAVQQQPIGMQTEAAAKSSKPHPEGSQSARISKPDSSPRVQVHARLNSSKSEAQGSQSARVHQHPSSTRLQQPVQEPVRAAQQHHQLQHLRQPISPKPHNTRNAGSASGTSSPPVQLPVAKASAKSSSPVMAHAVEHSSMSLSQLAVASRSKLRPPSSVHSPPKRAGKPAWPKQAAYSHLAKLAAAVPLPASPNGADGQSWLEDTATGALATAVAKPSHIPAPAAKPSRLKKPTNTSGFFSSGRSFTGAGSNNRPDFSQSLMSAAAASKSSQAAGYPSLARLSAPSVKGPQTGFPGPSAAAAPGLKVAAISRGAAPASQGSYSSGTPHSSGAPVLAQSSAPGPLGAAVMQAREAALESSAPSSSDLRQGQSQQAFLARPSISAQSRQGTAQLPPSGAPAKSGKSKGVMASVLGSVKKAVGIKSRIKDMQGDDSRSPQPERSAMSSMGFTCSQPSQSRLPSFSGLRSKASSSGAQAQPQRSAMSFGRRQPSFTREATPPLSSEVEELLRNEELAFQGRGGGVGNSPADRAAKEASLRQSAQERHWQDYAASLQ